MDHPAFAPFPAFGHARLPSLPLVAAGLGAVAYAIGFVPGRGTCSLGVWPVAAALGLLLLVGAVSGVLRDGRPSLAASAAWSLAWVLDVASSAQWPGMFQCAHSQLPLEAVRVVGSAALACAVGAGLARGVARLGAGARWLARHRDLWRAR